MPKLTFVDEARSLSKSGRTREFCKLQRFLDELTPKQRAEVQEALDQSSKLVYSKAINAVLRERFRWDGSDTTITDHRSGRCCCVRD